MFIIFESKQTFDLKKWFLTLKIRRKLLLTGLVNRTPCNEMSSVLTVVLLCTRQETSQGPSIGQDA